MKVYYFLQAEMNLRSNVRAKVESSYVVPLLSFSKGKTLEELLEQTRMELPTFTAREIFEDLLEGIREGFIGAQLEEN